ncbi:sigma-54-dependent transcriptional regulator family protein [Acinetobacter larvae]|nr:transcriptional regulator [Acinetobacter larvae]
MNHSPLEAAPLIALSQQESSQYFERSIYKCQSELKQVAQHANMAIGITDHQGTLRWTWSSQLMRNAAEHVNFIAGGHWSTQAVGRNAIGLALNQHRASCVNSHENHMHSVRDWVCYAAPIVDPLTGKCHGILNLSTKSQHHNSLGLLAVEHCANIVQQAIRTEQNNLLYLKGLGTPYALFNGQLLTLTHRQLEILCILALHPDGLHLEDLHQALYGERPVSSKTLKSELSQLRLLLPESIDSRPYRLVCEVQSDFLAAEMSLNAGLITSTFDLYQGGFMNKSESPIINTWRECFDARLSHFIYQMQDIDILFKVLSRAPERIDAAQRLYELLPTEHPYRERIKLLIH